MIVQNDGRGDARVASRTRYGCDFDWSMGGAAACEFIHVLAVWLLPACINTSKYRITTQPKQFLPAQSRCR